MHKISGRWKLGLALSITTATMWGMLPIALKGLLDTIDSVTITWYRFAVSLFFVALLLFKNKQLPNWSWTKKPSLVALFMVVILGLSSNYILYLLGLDRVSASAAQIVIQIAPLLLLLGGIVVFKENFSASQWTGVIIFVTGLLLFFNHRLDSIIGSSSNYNWGLLLVVFSAIGWAGYALAQKQLLLKYNSQQILFVTYIAASILFFPSSEIMSVEKLDSTQWFLLIFCCINTLIAYGCFAEALEHWEASRVGAVLAITPLMTIIFAYFTNLIYPDYLLLEPLNWLSLVGALILVIGSLTTALSKKKQGR